MSKTQETVYIGSRTAKTKGHYHVDKHCRNAPTEPRPIAKSKIPNHIPCGSCVPGASATRTKSNSDFECQNCGNIKQVNSTAARKRSACYECGEFANHERVDDE